VKAMINTCDSGQVGFNSDIVVVRGTTAHRFDRQSVANSGSCAVESHLNPPPIAVPVHVDLLTDVTCAFTSRELSELRTASDQLALQKTRRQIRPRRD